MSTRQGTDAEAIKSCIFIGIILTRIYEMTAFIIFYWPYHCQILLISSIIFNEQKCSSDKPVKNLGVFVLLSRMKRKRMERMNQLSSNTNTKT